MIGELIFAIGFGGLLSLWGILGYLLMKKEFLVKFTNNSAHSTNNTLKE